MVTTPVTLVPVLTLAMWILALTIKHVVADCFLQTKWMVLGKGQRKKWLAPLLTHAACHGGLTVLLIAAVAPRMAWLGAVDFVVHAVIDRSKVYIVDRCGLTFEDRWFWWLFSIDQCLHHLTGVAFAIALALP
jgi:hypothetical protein